LATATEPDRFPDLKLRAGVLARLSDDEFRLRLRRPYVRNSFSRLLYARYQATPSGSLIEVRLRLHPYVRWSTVLWFGFLILWTILLMVLTIADRLSRGGVLDASPWSGFLVATAMFVFGVLLYRTGRRDGSNLMELMQRTLQARPVP
jgi:hypothetical protein